MRIPVFAAAVVFAVGVSTCPAWGVLIAEYHFNEAPGATTAVDSVGGVNGALSATGAAFVPGGISGNAISLVRANSGFVNMGNNFPLTGTDFTIVAWVKTTTTALDEIVLGKHEAFSTNGYFLAVNPTGGGGQANKATFVAAETVPNSVVSTTSVNDDVWHQIVGVYVNGGNQSIYVDGVPVEATNGSAAMISNLAPFMIGGINASGVPTARFTGLVDEVQIYNTALSDVEIGALYTSTVPEPATLSLLGALVIPLLGRRRGRR
jgi:hypothetical protein